MERVLTSLPAVVTDRLRLRPLARADAEPFRVMTSEPDILAAVHFLGDGFTVSDADRLIAGDGDGRDCFWGVWRPNASTLLGTVGTHLRGEAAIEIGYWFATAARGQGYASEAVHGILKVLAEAYPHRRIFAECKPENGASWTLLETLGFAPDGHDGDRPGRKRLVRPA